MDEQKGFSLEVDGALARPAEVLDADEEDSIVPLGLHRAEARSLAAPRTAALEDSESLIGHRPIALEESSSSAL